MKIEYLVLADAMNFGPEGKINILGMGWRRVNLAQLPGPLSFSIIVSITAPPAEAGEYEGEFSLTLPDGTEEPLSRGRVVLAGAPAEAVLLSLIVGLEVNGKPFTQSGVHVVHVKVGTASADYTFHVNAIAAPAPQEPATDKTPSRRPRKAAAMP